MGFLSQFHALFRAAAHFLTSSWNFDQIHIFAFFDHSILMAWLSINEPKRKQMHIKNVSDLFTWSSLPLLLVRSIQVRRVGTYLMSMFSHYYTLIVSRLHAVMMVKMLNLWWQARRGSVPKPNLQLRMPLEDWPDRINQYYVWCVIQTIVSTMIMVWSWYNVYEITLQSPSIQSSLHVLAKLHLQTGTLPPKSFGKGCFFKKVLKPGWI